MVILSIILAVVRSSRQSTLRTNLRDTIESNTPLDPLEIEDIRQANVEFTTEVYGKVVERLYDNFPDGECRYGDFIRVVISVMKDSAGSDPSATLQMGHYLDRVIFKSSKFKDSESLMNVGMMLTALNVGVYGTVESRIDAMYDLAIMDNRVVRGKDFVDSECVERFIDWLGETCQLPADVRVMEVGSPYPIQNYGVGTGKDILRRLRNPEDKNKKDEARVAFGGDGEGVGRERWRNIMKARQGPCPWGECYEGMRRLV